jgi:nicotinate-nucleotide pyrophosphorylase (carboxylating)
MNNKKDYRRLIQLALSEDIGSGDITTEALVLNKKKGQAVVVAKASGIVSGLDPFMQAYKVVSPAITFSIFKQDGSLVVPGDIIIRIKGPLGAILTGERTAMNIISHLSGVATMTQKIVKAIDGYPAKILDTRKTMPGMRIFQKKAVRDGGAANHRMGLYDMYLIKENHIEAAGGIEEALGLVMAHRKKTKAKIEIEVKNLVELKKVLKYKVDYILLDNFSIGLLMKAVKIAKDINPDVILEASGNVDLKTVRKIAATGVDRISVGRITHSAPVLDLSLKVVEYQ